MAEAVLDDVEGMLDGSAHLRQRPLDRLRQLAQGLWQRLDDAALDRDVPRHVAVGQFGALVRAGIAGIAKHVLSCPCSSFAVWVMSASLAAVPVTVCTSPEATS